MFIALEALTLGVRGKLCLWKTLESVADQHEPLRSMDLAGLMERAQKQHGELERDRIAAGTRALDA